VKHLVVIGDDLGCSHNVTLLTHCCGWSPALHPIVTGGLFVVGPNCNHAQLHPSPVLLLLLPLPLLPALLPPLLPALLPVLLPVLAAVATTTTAAGAFLPAPVRH
jgi:hypothetical protein